MTKENVQVITLDGPSGTGKGTLCHKVAKHLGWNFLDSGALYRVLAVAAIQQNVSFDNLDKLIEIAVDLDLNFVANDNLEVTVILSGQDVTAEIRAEQTGQNASKLAALPAVREALLQRQRDFATAPGLVTDGRDMGTVVFPNASLKIYLDASSAERARRRHLQLQARGINVSLEQVEEELAKRDARDMAREHAPLKPAEDAVLIDTTGLTIAQVFANILQLIHEKL